MKKTGIFCCAVVLGSLMWAMPVAADTEEVTTVQKAEAKPVQQATYKVNNTTYTVVTFSDGTVMLTVGKDVLIGDAAMKALNAAGITLTVSDGQISNVKLPEGAQVVQAPTQVSEDQAAAASKQLAAAQKPTATVDSTTTPLAKVIVIEKGNDGSPKATDNLNTATGNSLSGG